MQMELQFEECQVLCQGDSVKREVCPLDISLPCYSFIQRKTWLNRRQVQQRHSNLNIPQFFAIG